MPAQYERIKEAYLKKGKSDKKAKEIAAKIFIASGKGGTRSSRAKELHKD